MALGGGSQGPLLAHSLFSIILSKLCLLTDDVDDYENSTAIHAWKIEQSAGMSSAAACCLRSRLVGGMPAALHGARGNAVIGPFWDLFPSMMNN